MPMPATVHSATKYNVGWGRCHLFKVSKLIARAEAINKVKPMVDLLR